jgi:hypothetical protein
MMGLKLCAVAVSGNPTSTTASRIPPRIDVSFAQYCKALVPREANSYACRAPRGRQSAPRGLSLCYTQIMKFSAREIAQATGGLIIDGSPEALCDGVSTDSRTIRPGQLFVPLRGSRCDGHEFIADARARGAAGVLLQTPPPAPPRPDFIWTVHLAAFGGKTNGPGEAWSPSPLRERG